MLWTDWTFDLGMALALVYLWVVSSWRRPSPSPTPIQSPTPTPTPTPSPFSVIVACRDEATRLDGLLDGLANQTLHPQSILFIDDGSTDGTAEKLRTWAAAHPECNAKVIASNGSGKKAALAMGFAALPENATHVLLTDADALPGPQWCTGWASTIAAHPETQLFIGDVEIAAGGGWRGAVERVEWVAMMNWAASTAAKGRPANASGANLLVKREAWLGANLKGEWASGDDVFLAQSLAKASPGAVRWADDPRTKTQVPPAGSWRELVAQRARWGRKSVAYPDRAAGATAALIVVMNLAMFPAALAGAWPVLAVKALADFAATRRPPSKPSPSPSPFPSLFPFLLSFPFVVATAILQAYVLPGTLRWKGRAVGKSR